MTPKERATLDMIEGYIIERRMAPSLREIGDAVGMKSKSEVHRVLTRLKSQGLIDRHSKHPRCITVTDPAAIPVVLPLKLREAINRRSRQTGTRIEDIIIEAVRRQEHEGAPA